MPGPFMFSCPNYPIFKSHGGPSSRRFFQEEELLSDMFCISHIGETFQAVQLNRGGNLPHILSDYC